MKKNFPLTSPKHKPDRVVESVKAEVNKYLARERRKKLPENIDYWDFDCKVGADASSAKEVHVKEISKSIDEVAKQQVPSVYISIFAKPAVRAAKPKQNEAPRRESKVTPRTTAKPSRRAPQKPARR